MNYESRFTENGSEIDLSSDEDRARRNRRRIIIAAGAALIALVVVTVLAFGGGKEATPVAGEGAGKAVPVVTVMVPGRHVVDRVVSATGSIGARREMPVGVVGEGGMVVQVHVEPGDWVGAGQVLATIERSVQTQQNAQLAAQINVANADARLAQAELERAQALVSRGFISKADIERKTATRDAAIARVRVAEATLAENRARTGRLDIRAPAAGLVLTRAVEPGQVVGSGSGVLFRLAKGGEMELLAQLSEADLMSMPVGSRATVTPVGSAESFSGSVWQVSPVVDPQTRQGTARIALSYNNALRPGGFAAADIVRGSQEAPMLPESAVQSDAKGNFVYLVDKTNKIVRRDITVGDVTDKGVAVSSGLTGSERVVSSAGGFVNPGETVKPVLDKAAR
ncbi:efflux RND transporter periplasmic adaptor subunit [Sphingomonas sp. LaA6.9]|uniref:efflux RND transporter periplasmic adaptor subunit n=1 Tax=Sphingomonas sp. LaA6.9 TaxID=2919914 RepID=UPI001F4FBC8A|nr:efflux RND transporter periplasmic adaptor subunit [Sphingomonas sp. LaA6.9]MCJ8156252.1 efflux RND transporter periplasmic adaptor subunit [Sphingomonas sp. LaA6.9]